ncbi:hypothetical protein CHARACLAT_008084 [Characodon lateralis]|uniref:Uncharacterized protein n=1 Tax=Characodon lateralis TaxID=208331 RepID=A0ABU7DYR0_9TELE|nr:hypothetical protein [Characodon lateralis]
MAFLLAVSPALSHLFNPDSALRAGQHKLNSPLPPTPATPGLTDVLLKLETTSGSRLLQESSNKPCGAKLKTPIELHPFNPQQSVVQNKWNP